MLRLAQARYLPVRWGGSLGVSGHINRSVLLGSFNGHPFVRSFQRQAECKANTNKIAKPGRATPARLVVTHSSYMDGLIPLLDRFVADPDTANSISSVIPGRIYVVKGRSEHFKVTVRDTTNGFKALVRKGTLGQDVFISTTKMDLEGVKAALNRAAGFDLERGGSRRDQNARRKRR